MCTMSAPKIDGIKCYDAVDAELFAALLVKSENMSSSANQLVIAQFSDGSFKSYENLTRYLEAYTTPTMCTNPNCKEDHSKPRPEPRAPTPEEFEKCRMTHEDGCKKIVENYLLHLNHCIVASNLVSLYNRVQKVDQVSEDLRAEVEYYARNLYYKSCITPLRNHEDMSKVASIMTICEEAASDDAGLSLMLTRVQRKTRNKDYVMHCLAFFAGLKFDEEEGSACPHGRGSMYI